MGKGIDLARADAPLHAQVLDDFKDQLLIALIRRLAGPNLEQVIVPVADVDATGGFMVLFAVDEQKREFQFEVRPKQ